MMVDAMEELDLPEAKVLDEDVDVDEIVAEAVIPGGPSEEAEEKEKRLYKEKVWQFYKSQVPVNKDLTAERNERVWALPGWVKPLVVPMLEDERDYIAFEMLANLAMGVLPLVAVFWYYPSHIFGIVFLVYRLLGFAARFFLTLHVVSHRRLFKKQYWPLNYLAETVGAALLGMPPGFYTIHHVMMHHCENNIFPSDISSTMPYQRDSYVDLARYISKYFTHGALYLPYYCWKKNRYQLLMYHLFFSGIYFSSLFTQNSVFFIWMLHMPFLVMGCALMKGNFGQHLFIDPAHYDNSYSLAYNYMNHPDNQKTYNDGYHIVHHLHSKLHWSEMPQWFETNIDKFARMDSLVFQNIDNDGVFSCVFSKDYKRLFECWVQLDPDNVRDFEQFKDMITERLKPIHAKKQ